MKVLIVEDNKILSDTIKQCIKEKYDVEQEFTGEDAYIMAQNNIYDVIILDLMLPEINGYDILKKLREKRIFTPVLILTAKDGLEDKIKGFKYGADDYLIKPFESEELLARIEAIIRRTKGNYKANILEFKKMKLNLNNRQVYIENKKVCIQGKQFDFLEYLIGAKNTIITKEQIFDKIWGFNSDTTANVVEVYASGLRKILKEYKYDKYIKTIRGVGYMITDVVKE